MMNVDLSLWTLSIMILSTSFFGSWHCAGMCSPLSSLASQRHQLLHYHAGRMLSYTFLGALAGFFGKFFLGSNFKSLQILSIGLLSLTLITMGIITLNRGRIRTPESFHQILQKLFGLQKKYNLRSGIWIGLFSGLLPCGWLYTFLLAAVSTRSALAGGLVLFLFTLGSVPALSAVSVVVSKNISLSGHRKQRLAGFILILAGIYSLVSQVVFGMHLGDSSLIDLLSKQFH